MTTKKKAAKATDSTPPPSADPAAALEAEAKARTAENDELKALREQNAQLLKANRSLAAALARGAARNTRAAAEMQAAIGMGGD